MLRQVSQSTAIATSVFTLELAHTRPCVVERECCVLSPFLPSAGLCPNDFLSLPSMMVMERPASGSMSEVVQDSTSASQLPGDGAFYQRRSSSSATPTQATVTGNTPSHSRNPSHATQPTPPTAVHPPQSAPHIRFEDAPPYAQSSHHRNESQDRDRQSTEDAPPPSPRLQPSNGSMLSLNGSAANSPGRIKVRDLSHIQSFASEEVLSRSRHPSRHSLRGRLSGGQQYEISEMPVSDIIEMVAGLLTKITTTNDRQHEYLHRHIPPPDGSSHLSQQATSVLAFHGKNVPSITIASYLNRIHKYCPTTYEVFLSLLVYFDRMTEMVNNGSLSSFTDKSPSTAQPRPGTSGSATAASAGAHPSPPLTPSQPARADGQMPDGVATASTSIPQALSNEDAYDISHFFVVDSYNIHRLVMAGVTCASKFFSDVFYTNSRYAKVCPL